MLVLPPSVYIYSLHGIAETRLNHLITFSSVIKRQTLLRISLSFFLTSLEFLWIVFSPIHLSSIPLTASLCLQIPLPVGYWKFWEPELRRRNYIIHHRIWATCLNNLAFILMEALIFRFQTVNVIKIIPWVTGFSTFSINLITVYKSCLWRPLVVNVFSSGDPLRPDNRQKCVLWEVVF